MLNACRAPADNAVYIAAISISGLPGCGAMHAATNTCWPFRVNAATFVLRAIRNGWSSSVNGCVRSAANLDDYGTCAGSLFGCCQFRAVLRKSYVKSCMSRKYFVCLTCFVALVMLSPTKSQQKVNSYPLGDEDQAIYGVPWSGTAISAGV